MCVSDYSLPSKNYQALVCLHVLSCVFLCACVCVSLGWVGCLFRHCVVMVFVSVLDLYEELCVCNDQF